ncbi:MAG TPA: trigger factor [Candidatus Saccharimonadales bacterium]|jgi:trigger factor|nr:trigger factor [Candidatus Saccharimonadales bacterium]
MQVSKKNLSDTKVALTIKGDSEILQATHNEAVRALSKNVKVQGFREGKAPLHLIEKQLNPQLLQTEFLERAINALYVMAIQQEQLRPVAQPQVKITKFVPFTTVEFEAEVEAIGEIKLPDYKTMKLEKKAVKVTAKDVDAVLDQLKQREAEKKEVKRAAKLTDQVWIDFAGSDTKTGDVVDGADGKDYPLILGSKTFIPGFEDNLIGMKAGEEKTFDITFPKDYGVAALQNKKVTFKVTVKKVEESTEPKVDDAFAAKVGPFKTLADLKEDIKRQLIAEQQNQADREFADELVIKIAEKTKVVLPDSLIEDQLNRMDADERQNLVYRGQTWEEHLKAEGVTEAEHRKRNRAQAEQRVKVGLVLTEIAEREKIEVTPEELELRIQLLKGQYQDPQMQAELDKLENRRELASRLMSEKTLNKITSYATAKTKTAKA